MAYSKVQNQSGVPRGQCRYRFDERYRGKRYREHVVCRPSDLKDEYRNWQKQFMSVAELGDFRLFEIIDEYLEFVRGTKSSSAFRNEALAMRMCKLFYNDMYLRDFKRYHVDDYMRWLKNSSLGRRKKVRADATVNRYLAELSCFFTYCIERDYYRQANPCFKKRLKLANQREIRMTDNHLSELLEKAEGKLYIAILLAMYCGLRRGEIVKLKWSDIDFSASIINLSAQYTKSRRRREVSIPDAIADSLHREQRERPFEERVLGDWTEIILRNQWDRLRDSLSFRTLDNGLVLHFHDLRHVYAQALRDADVPMGDIQTLLGHSSVRVTEERYAQFGGRNIHEKVNRIQRILPIVQKSG